ncbi:MAG TPA: hypothetical protein V6D08_21675, partial [Candidatus Obscuribacterales bacterium]
MGRLESRMVHAFLLLTATALPAYGQTPDASEIERFLDTGWQQPGQAAPPAQAEPVFQKPAIAPGLLNQTQSPLRLPQGRSFPASGDSLRSSPFPGPARLTPQDIFRILFGGGAGGGQNPDAGQRTDATYRARSELQVARDQAAQAESAASRAQYGSDRYAKSSAAAEAQNHANAARAAADRATSAAGGGPSEALDAAAQARNEAARA